MCGMCCICCMAPGTSDQQCPLLDLDYISTNSFISRRGPDVRGSIKCSLWSKVQALFAGFVLHMRGELTPQPLRNDDGDLLLWNGEIFDGIEVGESDNDTQVLFDQLVHCQSEQEVLTTVQRVQGPWALVFWQAKRERLWFGRDVFGRRSLLWHLPQREDGVFALSSVPIKPLDFEEVPSVGMFCLETSQCSGNMVCQDFSHCGTESGTHSGTADPNTYPPLILHLYPWQGATWPGTDDDIASDCALTVNEKLHLDLSAYMTVSLHSDQPLSSWMPVLNSEIPDDGSLLDVAASLPEGCDLVQVLQDIERRGELAALVTQLVDVLQKAVVKRVHNLPRPHHQADSGDHLTTLHACGTNGSTSDAFGFMSFKNHHCEDFQGGLSTGSLQSAPTSDSDAPEKKNSSTAVPTSEQSNHVNCVLKDGSRENVVSDHTNSSVSSSESKKATLPSVLMRDDAKASGSEFCSHENKLFLHSDLSVTKADVVGDLSQKFDHLECQMRPAQVAILFSGGVDSTVLAALADRCLPADESVDLINVAFEQKTSTSHLSKKKRGGEPTACPAVGSSAFNVPDRLTGYSALSELNPQRQWNFLEVNVTQEMLQVERSQHVRHLVYPLKTVLDDSIGCAVWFAAKGKGIVGNGPNRGAKYTSTARVILCGMGADEQLAGYSRHRVRFKQESWPGLISEINMELHRISARNLGRDDRIITDHGKESRLPFLDEDVVSFLAALPMHLKADLRLPRGVGEKMLLRLAAVRLGLPTTATLPKRAIQFGSRIAKLEQSKEKGAQVCNRLMQD